MKKIVVTIAFTLTSAIFLSQTFSPAKMDSLISALNTNNKSMGSLSISKKGKTIYSKAWGYSAIGVSEKVNSDTATKFRIGSISKMFTAIIIFQLIDEKKIKRSDLLSKYYPEIPNAKKITIDNLLNHHSGLYNFTDTSYLRYLEQPQTQKQMLDRFAKQKTDFEPGEKAEYSNTNFVLLGYIIEKITKKTLAENLQLRIAKKIGLKSTRIGGKINLKGNEAFSFKYESGGWQPHTETDMSIPGGAGAVISTPNDLTKLITALFNKKLMSDSCLKVMTTMTDRCGRGIFNFPFGERTAIGHNGAIDGFNSMLCWFANDSSALALICNGSNISSNDQLIGMLSIYFGKPYAIPSFKIIVLPDASLQRCEGVYSSKELPIKITIKKTGNILSAQATGQSAFDLETVSETASTAEFKFDQAGVKMIFSISDAGLVKQFTLKQGGGEFLFVKE